MGFSDVTTCWMLKPCSLPFPPLVSLPDFSPQQYYKKNLGKWNSKTPKPELIRSFCEDLDPY